MGSRPPSIGRVMAMVIFAFSCFGLLLFLWLSFGGAIPLKPKGYQVEVSFDEATQLAEQADVRIAGVSVGKVVGKELDPNGNGTLATIRLERRFAPLKTDAKARLRQKTLLGETYVELTSGTRAAADVPEGGRLADGRVEPSVEFDEFLEIFPQETRDAFRRWQRNSAETIEGRDRDFNDALGNFGPFARDASSVLRVLERRRGSLRALVRDTGVVFEAFTRDEESLRALLADTSRWFQATGAEREALAEAIGIFPTFLDETKLTFERLETFSRGTKPLITELRPVLRDLQPTLRDLHAMSTPMRTFFGDLDPLIEASEDGLPALSDVLRALGPTLTEAGGFLSQLNPILQWLEQNQGKVSDFIAIGGHATGGARATNNPNGNGRVLPQLITTGNQSLLYPSRPADQRGNTYLKPDGILHDARWRQGYYIYPNWDCAPSGGEKKADGTPGCFVQEPIPFQGRNERFPRLEATP